MHPQKTTNATDKSPPNTSPRRNPRSRTSREEHDAPCPPVRDVSSFPPVPSRRSSATAGDHSARMKPSNTQNSSTLASAVTTEATLVAPSETAARAAHTQAPRAQRRIQTPSGSTLPKPPPGFIHYFSQPSMSPNVGGYQMLYPGHDPQGAYRGPRNLQQPPLAPYVTNCATQYPQPFQPTAPAQYGHTRDHQAVSTQTFQTNHNLQMRIIENQNTTVRRQLDVQRQAIKSQDAGARRTYAESGRDAEAYQAINKAHADYMRDADAYLAKFQREGTAMMEDLRRKQQELLDQDADAQNIAHLPKPKEVSERASQHPNTRQPPQKFDSEPMRGSTVSAARENLVSNHATQQTRTSPTLKNIQKLRTDALNKVDQSSKSTPEHQVREGTPNDEAKDSQTHSPQPASGSRQDSASVEGIIREMGQFQFSQSTPTALENHNPGQVDKTGSPTGNSDSNSASASHEKSTPTAEVNDEVKDDFEPDSNSESDTGARAEQFRALESTKEDHLEDVDLSDHLFSEDDFEIVQASPKGARETNGPRGPWSGIWKRQ